MTNSPLSRHRRLSTVSSPHGQAGILHIHLVRAMCMVLLGIAAIVCASSFLSQWTAVLLAVIAIPPGILFGNVWMQICRKHLPRLEQSIWPTAVFTAAYRREPVLFWLGMLGTLIVCGCTYLLILLPSQAHITARLTDAGLYIELCILYGIMLGVAEITDVFFLYRTIIEQRRHRRVTERLTYDFLEKYEYHKN
jgi:uncharacterized protein YneF (UPF0154 family)